MNATLKVLRADITDALQALVLLVAVISAFIVSISVGTLLVYALTQNSASGVDLFFKMMSMDVTLFARETERFILQEEIRLVLAAANWLVLIGGLALILHQGTFGYIRSLKQRARYASSIRAFTRGGGGSSSSTPAGGGDAIVDFKRAGNS